MKATLKIMLEWDDDLIEELGEDDPKIIREQMTRELCEQVKIALKDGDLVEDITFDTENHQMISDKVTGPCFSFWNDKQGPVTLSEII